jgi:transcriptional regulator with XRE-family HTH domain
MNNNHKFTLGGKIKELRASLGMTLEELGAKCGSSKGYIFDLEAGKLTRPSAQKLSKIALALRVSAEFLLDNDLVSPTEKHFDDAFFESYKKLNQGDKETLRKIIKAFI